MAGELGDELLVLVLGDRILGDFPADLLLDEPRRNSSFRIFRYA